MKKQISIIAGISVLCIGAWRCGTQSAVEQVAVSYNQLPQDVMPSCTVSADTFNTWFAAGTAVPGGRVTAANSVTFPSRDNCDFYVWSERMFLWLTSPNASGKGIVLESPLFYDVSPKEDGSRVFIPHTAGAPLKMTSSLIKTGPNGLPVMVSKTGRLLEIQSAPAQSGARLLVANEKGASTQVAAVKEGPNGGLEFIDATGNPITHPKAIIRAVKKPENVVQQFSTGKRIIYLDKAGNIIESESGQATGDGLIAQNGALVYYLSMVNDVYAHYLTYAKQGLIDSTRFPATAAARDSICALARKQGVVLPDSNALAMEIKSSWVETSTLADSSNYVTIIATVTKYDTSKKDRWVPIGEKTVSMALVGIHIVGSVAGHPEMVWATLEHYSNTPNASYDYLNNKGQRVTVPAETGTGWLFNNNPLDSANVSHVKALHGSDTLVSKNGYPISASNTRQISPWGTTPGQQYLANQEDTFSYISNAKVISINNSIRSMLDKDVRQKYLLIGATWTFGGTAPNGYVYGYQHKEPGVSIGTNTLANTTMETYFQSGSKSCFTCHSGDTPTLYPGDISHIYSSLLPLLDSATHKSAGK